MHGVSHSCWWPLAGCDGGWDSSRDSSGDSLQAVQCLCAYLATQARCQVTERGRSSELLFLSLDMFFCSLIARNVPLQQRAAGQEAA